MLSIAVSVYVSGQIPTFSTKSQRQFSTNQSLKTKGLNHVTLKTMPAIDTKKLLEEDKVLEGLDVPYNIGYLIDVNYSTDDGTWEETSINRIWSMRIYSRGASEYS